MAADPQDQVKAHGFLANGGEMAARVARFDWTSTPIGPIETWPHSLTNMIGFMLASPVPLVLLWGEHGVMIYNDAYSVFAGGRNSRLLGSNVREGWDEIAEFNDNVMRVGLAGGTLSYRNHELTLRRQGRPESVWMDLDYSPVPGDDGKPAGVMAVVVEVTAAVLNRQALEQSEARLRLIHKLEQTISDRSNAADVLAITTRMLGEHLAMSGCAYAELDADQTSFTVRDHWQASGALSLAGHHQLGDLGQDVALRLRAGTSVVIDDAHSAEAQLNGWSSGIVSRAMVCMPLTREARLAGLILLLADQPRTWSASELSLIREVADRSWMHVQRVKAEEALRASQTYNRQILDGASDYGIVATDLGGLVTLWNRAAERMLGWTEQEMIGEPIAMFFTPEDRAAGRPEAKRLEALETGRTQDARWHLRKTGERFWGLSEMVPLCDEGGHQIGLVKLIRDRTEEYAAQEALRRSEERLHRAQAAGGMGLFSLDIDTDIIHATDEFCRIFGVPVRAELPAEEIQSTVILQDKTLVSNRDTRGHGNALLDIEYRIRRADNGEERTIARRANFEFDAAGKPIRLVGTVQDVTDRVRTQRALEKSEAQFSVLARNMPNQVWTADANGKIDWFSEQIYTYSGEPYGRFNDDLSRLLHPQDIAESKERWRQSVATGAVYEAEFRLRDAQGRYRWHLARAQPLTDSHGEITAWVGTNTEIEAQKQAEAESARDRERLWVSSQDLMLVCDFAGKITAVNPSGERMLGWSEEEMVARHLVDFIHPDDIEPTAAEMTALGSGATTLAFENRYRTESGSYRLLAWTAVPAENRVHAIGRDITDQRDVEAALRQSHKMEAVGQLTGGIAHDFNNLLQGITGGLDIIQSRLARGRLDDLDRWLDGARSSAERAASLTHRLLAFSRRQPLDPRPVEANPLIRSMQDLLDRTLDEDIDLHLTLAEGLWTTRCDPNQLESAILNLAINARDAMPGGGTLTISTTNASLEDPAAAHGHEVRPGQYVCITVSDTGTGMTKETIEHAFEPFFTTKPTGQGTGLGLSMIYGFARQSEGHAVIESAVGSGSSIHLYLPRHLGAEVPSEPLRAQSEILNAHSGEVVLVIEDEEVVRGLIVEVLGELGYSAIEASDGPQGLAILEGSREIDLLITDIGLPGLNGRKVVEAARVKRPDLKVLFMTGYAETAAQSSGFLDPGMNLITKPFAIDVLATRIREIIKS